jgi:hypothetical protein
LTVDRIDSVSIDDIDDANRVLDALDRARAEASKSKK